MAGLGAIFAQDADLYHIRIVRRHITIWHATFLTEDCFDVPETIRFSPNAEAFDDASVKLGVLSAMGSTCSMVLCFFEGAAISPTYFRI